MKVANFKHIKSSFVGWHPIMRCKCGNLRPVAIEIWFLNYGLNVHRKLINGSAFCPLTSFLKQIAFLIIVFKKLDQIQLNQHERNSCLYIQIEKLDCIL